MEAPAKGAGAPSKSSGSKKDWRRQENKRGVARRGGRKHRKDADGAAADDGGVATEVDAEPKSKAKAETSDAAPTKRTRRKSSKRADEDAERTDAPDASAEPSGDGSARSSEDSSGGEGKPSGGEGRDRPRRRRRRRRRSGAEGSDREPKQARGDRERGEQGRGDSKQRRRGRRAGGGEPQEAIEFTGMFVQEKGGFGTLRRSENQYMPSKQDVYVPKHLVSKNRLRDGALVTGKVGRGQGKHKHQLNSVLKVDGRDPAELASVKPFKTLTSIDPDFHYEVGDPSDDASMRVLDLVCPIGRGTRGLIVAPPRSGKTILMRKFAAAVEDEYPDVHLIVLLVDERPEEATEWRRSIKNGEVFVSTNDEMSKHHVQLAEAVWRRACRLVELGEDVILLLDSITRLARAYNNIGGGSGRTMSGGIDSRTMERPRAIFGSARNTETAGSLTILGTTLVETGSRMDQVIFEEFKGTGNMELVLSRKLADRRIFPAIDIERSGTRKEEKLLSRTKMRRITTLRRVLLKMNFIEAMELLINKLEDVEKTDDFLQRFEVDPEA